MLAPSTPALGAAPAQQPHIVLILADDWGQYNAGYRNGGVSRTPAIDALAAESLELSRFYVHKWCAPSRSALMTGRNPMHTGLDPLNWTATILRPNQGTGAVSEDYVFLPRVLQQARPKPYYSAMLGKWHLGYWKQAFTPVGRGFCESFGFLGGFETYSSHMMWNGRFNASAKGPNAWYSGPFITDLWDSDHAATDARYNGTCDEAGVCACTAAAIRANGGKSAPRCRYSSYMYTEKAVALIEAAGARAAADAAPAFFYFAVQSVHSPYQVPKEYLDLFPDLPVDSLARREHAMVAALDDFVGNVSAALRAAGMWEDTLLILHSDNGAVQAAPQPGGPGRYHNPNGTGSLYSCGGTAYPLRGAKPVKILQNTFVDRTHCIAQLRTGSSFLLECSALFVTPDSTCGRVGLVCPRFSVAAPCPPRVVGAGLRCLCT